MLSTSVVLALIGVCVSATMTPSMASMMTMPSSNQNDAIYSIYVPRRIRPGMEVVINVQLIRSQNPISASVKFESVDHQFTLKKTIVLQNGSFVTLPIGMLPLGYNGIKKFRLTINGTDHMTNMLVFRTYTEDFVFHSKSVSILIETDKPMYQPKETMKFRAICMTPDLRPWTGNVTYQVEDPKENIVLLSRSVPLTKGVVEGHLDLSRHAMEGEWVIKCKCMGTERKVSVNVTTFMFPKFEVKMTAPKFIYPDSEGITVTVKANKKHGARVYGKMRLVIGSNRQNLKIIRNNFRGEMDVFIPRKQIMTELRLDERSEHKIKVVCFVTETLTSIVHHSSAEMEYKQSKILIDVLSKPQVVKPGLRYQALVKVSDRKWGTLMEQDRQKNNLIVVVKYNYQPLHSIKSRPLTFVYEVPHNSIVPIDIEIRNDSFKSMSFRVYTNETASIYSDLHRWNAFKALSPSNSFIQILPTEDAAVGEVVVGKSAKFIVNTNKPVKEVQFMAVCRGSVLFSRTVMCVDEKCMMSNFSFNVTSQMTPSVTVIASYFTEENEVVADSIKVSVDLPLAKMMILNTNNGTIEAGSNISISINTTTAHAYVGLRAVDQRVLLLESRNNITKERVIRDLEQYSGMESMLNSVYRFSLGSHSKVAKKVFEKAGMTVLSNAWFYSLPPQPTCELNRDADADFKRQDKSMLQIKPVTTWLWESGETNDEGIAEFNAIVPEAITSWEISAFSMSESLGLGIADVQKLTVFRKFFVSLNMPLKIVRGEIIVVEANVFNNYDSNLTARIELNIPRKYTGVTLMRPGSDSSMNGPKRSVFIPSKGFATVKFPLKMNSLGEIPIKIVASSPWAVDTAERRVHIKPEGIEQCYSSSVLIRKTTEEQQVEELMVKVPEGAVNGSARATVHIYDDILGSTLTNLGKLLKSPNGSGEQNMLNFAPDIFVTLYLRAIGKLSEEKKERAIRLIIDGYMNQLRYKRVDGSFSAFGDRDAYGSTWLTAFVTQCFLDARELKKELIQKSVVEEAARFLLRQQKQDGSFEEKGRVIYQDMQVASRRPITMTAYVLITLKKWQMENPLDTKLHLAIGKARRYLERSIHVIESDAYALSVVSYALSLCGSNKAEEVGQKLDALAIETPSGFKFWNRTEQPSTYLCPTSRPCVQATPKQIETAAYALLRFARTNARNKALPVLRWLISKQNELGGYSLTQDTCVAIQALAKVALLFDSDQERSLSIEITHSKDDTFVYELSIREKDSTVNNSVEVTPVDGMVNVTSQGIGIAVAQLSVCYNTPTTPYDHEPFTCHNVSLEKKDDTTSKLSMKFCCSLDERRDPTEMFLFEVGLLNGYTVDVLQEEQRNPMAKLIELGENSVNLYYDQLYPGDTQCINLQLLKDADVGKIQPATVKAFEYYRPENVIYRMYNLEELSMKGPCDTCGYECVGCPAPMLSEWKPWTDCVEFCLPENSTRVQDCIDPSLKARIEMHRCGLEEPPMETRRCEKDFRCPDVSDGLWYEMPSSYPQWDDKSHPCQVIGQQRSPWTVIPGTTLNGTDSYICCSISLPVRNTTQEEPESTHGEILIDMDSKDSAPKLESSVLNQTFTISFLIKLNFFEPVNATTLFSIGKVDEVPLIKLEKPTLGRHLTFSADVGNKRDRVENIPLCAIPLGKWTHIVAMWNRDNGCKVLVNGIEVGQPTSYTLRDERPMPSDIKLNLGNTTMKNTRGQGLVSGFYSALNMWFEMIPDEEIESLCKFYQEIRQFSGPEPKLSARHLRSFAPAPAKMCFNKPAFLSMVYARDAMCE